MTEIEIQLAKLNGMQKEAYEQQTSELFRKKYSQSAVEAIINNYLLDPENEKYKAEFSEMQAYRAECKAQAKEDIYGGASAWV